MEKTVEGGVGAEREHESDDRRRDRDGTVAPRRRGEAGQAQREHDDAGEKRVADLRRVDEPLRQRAPRRGAGRRVRGQRGRVHRDGLERELLALERAHAQVRPRDGPQDRGGKEEPGREAGEVARAQAAEDRDERSPRRARRR